MNPAINKRIAYEVRKKDYFLTKQRLQGLSAPEQARWFEFMEHMTRIASQKGRMMYPFPMPMISVISVASEYEKFCRLSSQLEWSIRHGCLNQALDFLEGIDDDDWSGGELCNWFENFPEKNEKDQLIGKMVDGNCLDFFLLQ